MTDSIKLLGKVFITGEIKIITGLHIGGSSTGINIGGVDNPIIRNSRNEPYIPGSSLKGKMRSLSEKLAGLEPNFPRDSKIQIHTCSDKASYSKCHVCRIFGVPAETGKNDEKYATMTRLTVRDVSLYKDSLKDAKTDLEYTEVKTEVTIDRVTSAANPRPIERVPEGAVFKDFEFCYGVYEPDDLPILKKLFEAMQLLEDDYLGGSGSRGSGRIKFEDIKVECRSGSAYGSNDGRKKYELPCKAMEDLLKHQDCIVKWIGKEFNLRGENHENDCIQTQP
jgi:CRISPR-associated protein Csm3